MNFKEEDLKLASRLLQPRDELLTDRYYIIEFVSSTCNYELSIGLYGDVTFLRQIFSGIDHRVEYYFSCNEIVFRSGSTEKSFMIGLSQRNGGVYFPRLLLAGNENGVFRVLCYGIDCLEGCFEFPKQL